jgi:hypothetical protein
MSVSGLNQPDLTCGLQLNDVAVKANELAIAAWKQFSYSNRGGVSIGVTISGTTGFSLRPEAAVCADGTMAVSWMYQNSATNPPPQQKIQGAVWPVGSASWTTRTLATGRYLEIRN